MTAQENIIGQNPLRVAVIAGENPAVHIHHIGAFVTRQGDGSLILAELCRKADCFNISLSVSHVYLPNGKDPRIAFDCLLKWYNRFDFSGNSNLMRMPRKQCAEVNL